MAETNPSIGAKDQPITRHPLFPAIVALWCGALAGLASVLVGTTVIEGLVLSLGIDKVVPMAAPPLGTTMRILLVLVMTGIGAAVGAVVACRIARSATSGRFPAYSDVTPTDGEDAEGTTGRRRRPLAITQPDPAPVDDQAPLPGQATQAPILNVADFDIDSFDEATPDRPMDDPQVHWGQVADDTAEDTTVPAWLGADAAWHDPAEDDFAAPKGAQVFRAALDAAEDVAQEEPANTEAPIGSRLFEAYSRELSPRALNSREASDSSDQVAPGFTILPRLSHGEGPHGEWPEAAWSADDGTEPVETASFEQAIPLAAPAIDSEPRSEPTVVTSLPDEEDVQPEYRPAAFTSVRSASTRIADADLASLSQVELVERLALAMERRREEARQAAEQAAAAYAAPIVAPFAAPTLDAPRDNGKAGVATNMHDRPTLPEPISGHLRPVELAPRPEASDLAPQQPEAAIPFPSSPFSAHTFSADRLDGHGDGYEDQSADEDQGSDEDDTVLRQGYSSLLNLSRHAVARKPVLRFSEADDIGDDIAHASPPLDVDTPFPSESPQSMPFAGTAFPAPADEDLPSAPAPRAFDAPAGTDPDATENALRAALATLQRMSGAA